MGGPMSANDEARFGWLGPALTEVAQLLKPHHRLREPNITRRIEAAALKGTAVARADAA